MKVLNGKKSTLVFQLDTGETLRVQPGKISNPFIGTLSLVRSIISSGKPGEVGFVVSNAYELNMIKDIPIISQYYFSTEEDAKAAIFEGKNFEAVSADPNERKIAELEAALKAKTEENETLKENLAKPSSENADLIVNLRKQVADKEAEINALTSRNNELRDSNDEFAATNVTLNSKIDELQSKLDKASTELLEANNKLKDAVSQKAEEPRNADGMTLDEVTDLYRKLREQVPAEMAKYDAEIESLKSKLAQAEQSAGSVSAEELEAIKKEAESAREEADKAMADFKAKLDAKDAEIAQLKEDGAKVYEGYSKAKAAVQEIMQKFNIGYIDGQYVQQAN